LSQPRRVLVVDDEALVAMLLEDMLLDLGHEVVGPALNLQEALELAGSEPLDAAILDLNLGQGKLSLPVAELLEERGVPFVFATGYGADAPVGSVSHSGLLAKPFVTEDVRSTLERIL
jgi:CheY-like chemotaxis protein